MKSYETKTPCHHFRLVFTDGACLNNGQVGAKAGLGVAVGSLESGHHLSLPVNLNVDAGQRRTSQRAEQLAALHGLAYLSEMTKLNTSRHYSNPPKEPEEDMNWIIATDSEYVVKGMTEWVPEWKVSDIAHVQTRLATY